PLRGKIRNFKTGAPGSIRHKGGILNALVDCRVKANITGKKLRSLWIEYQPDEEFVKKILSIHAPSAYAGPTSLHPLPGHLTRDLRRPERMEVLPTLTLSRIEPTHDPPPSPQESS